MTRPAPSAGLLIGRSIALGAFVGLIAGAIEGTYRYFEPNPWLLLRPNLSCAILLLGPLINAIVGGLLGLVAGLFLASLSHRVCRLIALALGLCLLAGIAIEVAREPNYAATFLLGSYRTPARLTLRAAMLLAGAGTILVGRLIPFKHLCGGLAAVVTGLLIAVAVYAVKPSTHGTGVSATQAQTTHAPNIIFVTLDTLRADHLSVYGYTRRTTPNIDRWARQGVVFDNAISSTCWTLPSHASMFTGLLPHQHGADFEDPLDPGWWTLADILGSRGYQTGGFTTNLGYGGVGWGMGNGFALYDDDGTSLRTNLRNLSVGNWLLGPLYSQHVRPDRFERRDARQINRDVIRWFNNRASGPFYLFINYYDVHDPYVVPASYTPGAGQGPPWTPERRVPIHEATDDASRQSAEKRVSAIDGYDTCLAYLDAAVGDLFNSLSRSPEWKNTVVIITSDHGEAFGEHGLYTHGANLYREVLRVPLVIWGHDVPAAARVPQLVATQRLFETVLELAGVDNPALRNVSLRRFWTPKFKARDNDQYVVSELLWTAASPLTSISITSPEWQYLRDPNGHDELYHWISDPDEATNVARAPENKRILSELQGRLQAAVGKSLRPWNRPDYLSPLRGLHQPEAAPQVVDPKAVEASTSTSQPDMPIGASQAFFPHRELRLGQRQPSMDEELLKSLPYH